MIDIKLIRENADLVKENIKKKFQDHKLGLVDEVKELDVLARKLQTEGDNLKSEKNKISKNIGIYIKDGKNEEAQKAKEEVARLNAKISEIDEKLPDIQLEIKNKMMMIPNIIAQDVPIGEDDSKNVEEKRFGEPIVPNFEIPYHSDIMASFNGIDKDAAGRVSGNGFYYLMGDIARLHSAVLAYARDFMIDKGFTYCIPPYMIHGAAVDGVMSFEKKQIFR